MAWIDEQNPYHIRRYEKTFWNNITIMGDSEDECWNWNKSISKSGYGKMQLARLSGKGQVSMNASRYAYLLLRGSIPEGLACLHICDNKYCCNPNHLFLGTLSDNTRDMYRKGRDGIQSWIGKNHSEQARENMRKAWIRRKEREIFNSR